MQDKTAFLSVAELGQGYRQGHFTPTEVVEAALARIAVLDPHLNAFANTMAEAARRDAAVATAAFAAGQDLGPLQGIPIAIKDLIEVKGAPTGYGSQVLPPRIATKDATLVARLRTAGAVLLGKTNLLEYAYGIAHPAIGQTNNPHDPTRTAGGSSGGSAAAVAAGIVPLAIGTDTGGSIRIPASYCGILGLKPSFGLVPLEGVFPLSWSLDHAGPLARTAQCAATLLSVLADQPIADAAPDLATLRIGILRAHLPKEAAGAGVLAQFNAALAAMQTMGVQLIEIDIPALAHANAALVHLLKPEASLIHQSLIQKNPTGYAPGTLQQIQDGFKIPATDYAQAMRFREALQREVEAIFASVDLLAAPSVPFTTPHEDPEITGDGDSEILASGFANVSGHPSISLPCGLAAGLPMGLQLTAALGRDGFLLAVCHSLEVGEPRFLAPLPKTSDC